MKSNIAKRHIWKPRINRNSIVQEHTDTIISIDTHCHEMFGQLFAHAKTFEAASYQTSINCRQQNINESASVLVACDELDSYTFNDDQITLISESNHISYEEPLIMITETSLDQNIEDEFPSINVASINNTNNPLKSDYSEVPISQLDHDQFVTNNTPGLVLVDASLFDDNAIQYTEQINDYDYNLNGYEQYKTNIISNNDYTEHCFVVSPLGVEIPKVSPYVWQTANQNNVLDNESSKEKNGTIYEEDENQLELDLFKKSE